MLDSKESPCEKSPDYNFAHCVENKLAAEVGCKPYWIDIIVKLREKEGQRVDSRGQSKVIYRL